ncbi:methyl-accepting chemotaxis protein [Treponema parvum]|uniref:methyl-accepting chemotaxis protein n=1 Tax=Treponema parvum TaxID=138851 RepID=UPI001AEC1E9A|nr:methyl-accepting chemotaxis protein [Treponema parvum]QTQ15446.1 methyl-accepting chemotaxis protein [Treponema parvum]
MKKRFSLRYKLIIVFGLLIALSSAVEILLAVLSARKAVIEKVETHLIDKATDTAEIVDGRVNAFFQFFEGVARSPILLDPGVSYREKIAYLKEEAAFNDKIHRMDLADMNGKRHTADGQILDVSQRDFFIAASQGKNFVSEPLVSRLDGVFIIVFAVPIYNNDHKITDVLLATVEASNLSKEVEDIVVGKTGFCFILGLTGNTVAVKDFNLVQSMENVLGMAKTDASYKSLADFEKTAIEIDEPSVGFYEYNGVRKIASYATMKTTDWTIIINAPEEEFMGAVNALCVSLITIGVIVLAIALIVVYFVARKIVKPISVAVGALKDIAQGEGDLTVRLGVIGNDEITDMAEYFNQTIAKIGSSIKTVGKNSSVMEEIGNTLAADMTETASAVHEISANIDGVKQQALTQSASVTETAATIEEIVRTINQLNGSIENQAASVTESSSAIEQMVGNIASIGQTLEKNDSVIKTLADATADGKSTVVSANSITQKIAEESGSLIEASTVIQNIASQTNLLAMNAAIEAAHAGDAGKGFAVVADEIRKLAEDSAEHGKTITNTLKNLSGEIEALSNSSKTAEEKFNTIFSLAEQAKSMSDRVTEAMQEQENGSKEVLTAIRDINTVTIEVKQGSEEMLKGGEGVAQEMRKLEELTRVITESMNEMAAGAIQINNAVQEVNTATQKNKESIQSLAEEVGKFKV